jgi:hypothetical protein
MFPENQLTIVCLFVRLLSAGWLAGSVYSCSGRQGALQIFITHWMYFIALYEANKNKHFVRHVNLQ